jgi:hypothetical protein
MKFNFKNSYDISKANQLLKQLIESKKRIEIVEFKEKRSGNQNRYLHVLLTYFSNESGNSMDETKQLLKGMAGLTYQKEGFTIYKSTTDLDTKECSDFCEFIRSKYQEQFNGYLPTPEEYYSNQFEIEKECKI